jgi:(p)ppGpp synthase/HD superfamily hydrolase
MDDDLHAEPGIEPPVFVAESDGLSRAFAVARRAHSGHTRGGHGRPYLEHPIQVAELLRDEGYGAAVCAAGLLHDVVEDSRLTVGEVAESFGSQVGALVAALTEDSTIENWEERKLALRESVAESGPECAAVYIADKLANLHDWRLVYSEIGERSVEFFKAPTLDARFRAWHADLEMGERVAPGSRLNARLRRELEEFERERRGSVSITRPHS